MGLEMTPAMLKPCPGRSLGGIEHPGAHAAGDDDLGLAFALRQQPHDFNAVEIRHHQIDGDDLRVHLDQFLEEASARVTNSASKAEALRNPLDGLTDGCVIVEDENASVRHRPSSSDWGRALSKQLRILLASSLRV